jgi:hypothetical protein
MTKKYTTYCNSACETNYIKLFNQQSKPIFRTFQEAARHYKRDTRTMRKFEGSLFTIDKTLPSANTKWVLCVTCGSQSPKSKARSGYCSDCTAIGLGKKAQGIFISKRYKGSNNPNYLDGKSNAAEYQSNDWYRLKKELNYTHCALSNSTDNIDYHHIIPRWFCRLANINIFDRNNIIGLNHEFHKVVHHLQLDILLLPNLYSLYKKDAHLLQSHFVHLLQLHKVHQYPVDQLQSLHLFQISRYPGKKKLLHLLPGFLEPFLD